MKVTAMFRMLIAMLVVGVSGCGFHPGELKPWVKPYEREYLADPKMQFSQSPLSEKHLGHVRETREGARGAGIATGGGCGCN